MKRSRLPLYWAGFITQLWQPRKSAMLWLKPKLSGNATDCWLNLEKCAQNYSVFSVHTFTRKDFFARMKIGGLQLQLDSPKHAYQEEISLFVQIHTLICNPHTIVIILQPNLSIMWQVISGSLVNVQPLLLGNSTSFVDWNIKERTMKFMWGIPKNLYHGIGQN